MQGRSSTLLDILNLSLGFLGVDPVADYDNTGSTAADKCKRFMLLAIDEMQSNYLWKELLTTEELTLVVDKPRFYAIPSRCLRPVGALLDFSDQPETWIGAGVSLKYQVVGQELEVNYETDSPLNLFFVRRDDDPTSWSSELERCVAYNVAINACFLVTDNQNLYQSLETKLNALTLPKARELQSKYAKNYPTYLPSGFSNLQARLA